MNCLLCPASIDETLPVDPPDSIIARQKRAAELSAWRHVAVTTYENGGQRVVLSGHVCPNENLDAVTLAPAAAKKGPTK